MIRVKDININTNIGNNIDTHRSTMRQRPHEIRSQEIKGEVVRGVKPKQSEFMQKLERIKSDDVRLKIEDLYEKIIDKSNSLKNDYDFKGSLSLKGIVEYKNLVKDFVKLASENSFVFSQKNFLDRRGRHRVQTTIKQVDRELEEITQEFVKSHIDHSKVLKNMDAIRGMLIDIMM